MTEPLRHERRHTGMRTSSTPPRNRFGILAAAVLLAAGLAGCGDELGVQDSGLRGAGTTTPSASDELSTYDGEVCPEGLPEGSGPAGPAEPAESSPSLPEAGAAWVCRYDPRAASGGGDGGDEGGDAGDGPAWRRAGGPQRVPDAQLAKISDGLAGLEPAERDRMCTMDLGPRWMLVLEQEGDLTGVVMADYGCHDVLLTDDPHGTPPGAAAVAEAEGLVAGILTAPEGLLETVKAAAGQQGPGGQAGGGGDAALWQAMMGRLDCPAIDSSVFMHDMPEPEPGVTIRQALEPWGRDGAELVVDERRGDRATASVVVEGRTVTVLQLVRWDTGGWAVEGGAEC